MSNDNSIDISKMISHPGKGMVLDGIIGGAQIDSSGEILDVEGADTSSLESEGVLNWEHKSGDSGTALDVVGRCVYVKKIFKASDCEDDRQKAYFEKAKKTPIIYAKFRLFDGSGHPAAIACAAMIRDMLHAGEDLISRYSVEGSTIEKEGNTLKRTIVRAVALTLKPCNKASVSGVVADPNGPPLPKKSGDNDPLKSLADDTQKFEHPSQSLLATYHCDINPVVQDTVKKMEAGSYNAAPGTLTGGAALQREHLSGREVANQAKAALRDYDWHTKEASKDHFKKFLKHRLPEADDAFIDRFADMVDDYRVKLNKAEPTDPVGGPEAFRVKERDDSAKVGLKRNPLPKESKAGVGKVTPPKLPSKKGSPKPKSAPTQSGAAKNATRIIAPDVLNPYLSNEGVSIFGMVAGGHDEFGNERGMPRSPKDSYFDPETGYLHTDCGSFKVHIPEREPYLQILNSERVQKPHDDAMKHWLVLHDLALKGKLPPEVVMASALFSGQSPSVAVHMQEYAYSHLVDMINRGMDPTARPGEPGAVGPADETEYMHRTATGGPTPDFRGEYWSGPAGDVTRIGMSNIPDADGDEADGEGDGDTPVAGNYGEQKGLLYPKQKFNSVKQYYKLHNFLVNALKEYNGDARTISRILMDNKTKSKTPRAKWNATRKELVDKAIGMGMKQPAPGKPGKFDLNSEGMKWVQERLPPDYFEATGIADGDGFAPKTTRYLLAMLGAGNVVVPDTHFIRHVFGLPTDKWVANHTKEWLGRDFKEGEAPFKPNENLKRLLWDSRNSHLLEAIDKYYVEHHPAYEYAVNRFFGGRPTEQALFPAFWAHWLSVAPDEERIGLQNQSFNSGTDHATYWTYVRDILGKHGLGDEWDKGLASFSPRTVKSENTTPSLITKVAMAHNEMHNALGPGAASLFYYSKLVPMLLREAANNGNYHDGNGQYVPKVVTPEPLVVKLESMTIDLKKALDAAAKVPTPIVFGGRSIVPGKLVVQTNGRERRFPVFGETKDHYIVGDYADEATGELMSGSFRVRKNDASRPKLVQEVQSFDKGVTLHSEHDSVPELTMYPEQKALIHGLNLEEEPAQAPAGSKEGVNAFQSAWRKSASGSLVYVKAPPVEQQFEIAPDFNDARRETFYYNMGRGFFGLGHYLPTTAIIRHPKTGNECAVVEGIKGGKHIGLERKGGLNLDPDGIRFDVDPNHEQILRSLGDSGELHKLALMNMIMGNYDRHSGNYMLVSNPEPGKAQLQLLDHGLALPTVHGYRGPRVPDYLTIYHELKDREDLSGGAYSVVHPNAIDWAKKLDPDNMLKMMADQKLPQPYQQEATRRLVAAQTTLKRKPNISLIELFELITGKKDLYPDDIGFGQGLR